MASETGVSIRVGLRAARSAREWAHSAPHYRGEFVFGTPAVFAVYGDSVGCGLGVTELDRTFAGVVARRLTKTYGTVLCRIMAESGAVAPRLLEQAVAGDELFAAVSVGTNDFLHGVGRAKVQSCLARFLDRLGHARRVVVLGPGNVTAGTVVPSVLRPLAHRRMLAYEESILRTVERFPNARHVGPSAAELLGPEDFAQDGFHPSDRAHRRIGELVWDRLHDAL
jgi:lysophospholipase L1-like esterase